MKKRKLGSEGLVVSEIGLGCMGMSEFYGARDDDESLRTIDRALELGVVEENLRAAGFELTASELEALDGAAPPNSAAGNRYPDMGHVNR